MQLRGTDKSPFGEWSGKADELKNGKNGKTKFREKKKRKS